MSEISILAIDLAKNSFQVCGVRSDGVVVFNRAVSRGRLAQLLADQQPCVVAMEACSTSHHRGRVAMGHGHDVRLIPANYVKPFVKRRKNDFADAAAIAEAASRPGMSVVAVKSAEKQGRAVAFRTHQCFVRQRTQLINALRGHLAEFGLVAPKGPIHLKILHTALKGSDVDLPAPVREMGQLTEIIVRLANELEAATKTDQELRRLCTVPGIGPVTAGAIAAFAPDLETFDSGRNFAAWLGLVPRQHSSGGKTRLGAVSKMGQCDIRKLLIVGAMSVIRWSCAVGEVPIDGWPTSLPASPEWLPLSPWPTRWRGWSGP